MNSLPFRSECPTNHSTGPVPKAAQGGEFKRGFTNTRMAKKETLHRLEELFSAKEVTDGFPSQQACLSWANKVAPLLRFNPQYHQTFLYYLQIISRNISIYTAEPTFRTMQSQVEMAIEELKIDITSENNVEAPEKESKVGKTNVLKLEPNIYGIGINLHELWKRAKEKLFRKRM